MKINGDQLGQTLKKARPAIIFIAGSEPLLVQEAFDAALAFGKSQGFTDREIFDVCTGFDWSSFSYGAKAPSLFSDKRILDIRLASLKIGDVGSKAFRAYVQNPSPDNLLIITAPKLDANAQKSKWVVELEKAGLLVTVWPVDRARLPAWIATRLKAAGLPHSPKISNYIAAQTEGNLLAAKQHIDKVTLLQSDTPMDEATIAKTINASNHYSVFDLVSSALSGDAVRAIRIVRTLKEEKTEATLALWAICSELRIAEYLLAHDGKKPFAQLCRDKGVWQKRQDDLACFIKRQKIQAVHSQLQTAARIDKMIKGISDGSEWETLEALVLQMSAPKGTMHYV